MKGLPDKTYYRPGEIAEYFNISVKVIYEWIADGTIQGVRVAGKRCLRISREEVEKMKVAVNE